jgi:hypothetical protein
MDWEFYPRGEAGDAYAASQSRIIIEGDRSISPLEIFVREVLQNSRDAAQNGRKAKVHFKLHSISNPGPKTNFLDAMGWPALKDRVAAANRIRRQRDEPAEFGDPEQLANVSLQVLEISETSTIGLVGREAVRNELDERRMPGEPPKAYLALTREDARREKQGVGSGGTYGLGKAVLWAASSIQTVLFFSRLSEPWEDSDGQISTHRAAAQARLGGHFLNNQAYRGLGYGGDKRAGWCRPIRNERAQEFATKVGIGRRTDPAECGTTILIPFWVQPDSDVDDDIPTHVLLARYAARYFWPAIVDETLEVTTESATRATENAANHLAHFQPFIELYRRVKYGNRGPQDAPCENLRIVVPKGPPPKEDRASATFVQVAMSDITREGDVREDFNRKVACIRGQGMVVGYAKLTGNTLVRPFVGLALGGRAGDTSPAGVRGDILLGYSEYVTHTKWDEKSANLKHWPDARPIVRDLLVRMRDYFERHSRVEQPPTTSDLSPLEEGLRFPGAGRVGPPPPPPNGSPQLRLYAFTRGNNNYTFDIRSNVEASKRPFCVDVWVEAAVETGNAAQADRFVLENLRTVPAGLPVETLSNGKIRISVPTLRADTQVRITGASEQLNPALFSVSEGFLKANVVKGADPLEDQVEIPGEESNA